DPKFDDDPRDTSTPNAMAQLLERIYTGKALSPASTKLLGEIQERNTTGKARIRARLPNGTVVAEKTGTIGGSVNNVGVITLPGNAGKLIVAVFIKKSSRPFEDRERVIADISRALYDYYLFEAPDGQ
ncbi:MAG TPA: serine hydrolase, partial [Sphingomicrobium sp.]